MRRIVLLISITYLFTQSSLLAQKNTDANIVGHVISNNQHIPFATVSLKGTTIGVNTDETGHYQLVNLPEGTFIIRAQSVGYKPSEKEVTIKKGVTTEIKFELEEDVLGIEEVVITADRGEMKRTESVSIVNTISPEIFSSSQSITLSEGISFSPGLRVENNCQNCGFLQVRMNGLDGPYSQILINSQPIFSGLASVYGIELIPANMIERVEVVRGGGSALYGSNAIAGTINIILKDPVTSSYGAGINYGITGTGMKNSGGASPDYSLNFNTSILSSDAKTGISMYGFTRERSVFDADNDGFSELASLSNTTIGTRMFHRLGARSKLTFDFFNIKEHREGGNKPDYPYHERDIAEIIDHDIKTGSLTFEKYFRKYDLFSAYVTAQSLQRKSYYGANRSLKDYGRSGDLTFNSGFQYKLLLNHSSIILGLENIVSSLTDEKLAYPDISNALITNDSILEIPHTENITISDQKSLASGAFIQYDLKFGKLKLGLGGRLENYAITDYAKNDGTNTGIILSPRVNLMYELVDNLQGRVSYSQGYRAPQIYDEDLHVETSGVRQVIHVNDPDLKQETSHSTMASLDYNGLIGTVSTGLLVEGFLTLLEDPFCNIIGSPDSEGKVIYFRENSDKKAIVRGLNFEFKMKPLTKFTFSSGFTVQSSRYDVVQQFNTRSFLRTPGQYGYFNGDYDFIKNACFSFNGTYTGRMLVPYFGPYTDPVAGELRESDPFFDLGFKIQYNFHLNGSVLQVFSGMKNIFNSYQDDFDSGVNRDPSYVYGPASPRSIYFGIRMGNNL